MENNRSWKLLSSEQLLKDKWIDVRSEIWERPDGTIIQPFYKYGFPDYATALAITKDGKVILERIFRQGVGQTCIEFRSENASYLSTRQTSADHRTTWVPY